MDWIEPESLWLGGPGFADELVRREPAEDLQASSEVAGGEEVVQVDAQLLVVLVVVSAHCGALDRAVHALDVAVGPGVVHLGQPVPDAALAADAIEDVTEGVSVLRPVGELHAIVGEHSVDAIGRGLDQISQEPRGGHLARLPYEAGEGELAGAIYGHEQGELALAGAQLRDFDVKIADRVASELALCAPIALDVGQPADPFAIRLEPMAPNGSPLQAAMQGGAGQVRDRWLQGVDAVVEGQQGVAPEGDDRRFLLKIQRA